MVVYDGRQRLAADTVRERLRHRTYSYPQTEEEALNVVFDFIVRRLADEAEKSTRECIKPVEFHIEKGRCLVSTKRHDSDIWIEIGDIEKIRKMVQKLNNIFEDLPYYHSGYYDVENNGIGLCVYIELAYE